MNRLVAHRGDMTIYPENSLLALRIAAVLGFAYIELDVQLSKDHEPMVIHDDNLKRTTGLDKNVKDLTAKEIISVPVKTSNRFKEPENPLTVPTLKQAVDMLNAYSKINLFVEIKKESVEHFGIGIVTDAVLGAINDAKFNVIFISFVDEVVQYIKLQKIYHVGYVLKKYDKKYYLKTKELQPDYLFCNVKKINKPSQLWQGSWKWVIYDINDPIFAYELLEQGVSFIETGDIVTLSKHEEFT